MTTENTMFKYNGRFISLKELEALYQSNEEQMREEEVEISETTNGPFIRYKISFLIKMYGDEKPFRRIPRNEVPPTLNLSTQPTIDSSDSDSDETVSEDSSDDAEFWDNQNGTAEKPVVNGDISPTVRLSNGIVLRCKDFPLFNVYYERNDLISGNEVLMEMDKLRDLFPLDGWGEYDEKKFSHIKQEETVTPICRVCKYTPSTPFLFFQHLLNGEHAQKLAECQVSRSSFKYWTKKLTAHMEKKNRKQINQKEKNATNEEPRTSSGHSSTQSDVPLLNPAMNKTYKMQQYEDLMKGPSNEPRVPLLDVPERNSRPLSRKKYRIEYYPLQEDSKMVVKSEEWMKEVNCKCLHCPGTPSLLTLWDVMQHVFDTEHSRNIMFTGTENDFTFWVELINRSLGKNAVFKSFTKNDPRVPLLDLPDSNEILLDNDPRVPLLDVPERNCRPLFRKKYRIEYYPLQEDSKLVVKSEEWMKEVNCKCLHCPGTPSLLTLWDVMQHVFDTEHAKNMMFTGTENDFKFWIELINRSLGKNAVFKSFTKNDPRVPLLDLPEDNEILLDKKKFQSHHQSIRDGEKLKKLVKTKEWEREMNVKCFHCPGNPSLATLWDVKEHIFNSRHVKHIRWHGTSKDFKFWRALIQN